MSVPSNIGKENFRLLYSSSDEESEDLHLEITPSRKKKIARRDRARSVTRNEMSIYSTNTSYVLHWGARGVTLVWLIALTWFAVSFYDKVAEMHTDIVKVSTSSSSVNDELQGCHTTAKELRGNASLLSARVSALEEKHNALALKVEAAVAELAAVTKQLADAPSLANTPRRMAELQQTVANFGSQIQGFDIAVEQAHKQSTAAAAALEEVKATLQRVEVRANQTAANITERAKLYRELRQRIDDVNGTLATRIEALRASVKDNNTVSSPATISTAAPTLAAPSAAPAPVSQQSHSAPPTPPPPPPVNAEIDTTVATTRGPVKPIITQ